MASSVVLVRLTEPLSAMRPLEILVGALYQRQQCTTAGTGRLAEDGHILWVAAKAGNVLMHPLQCLDLIQKSQVL